MMTFESKSRRPLSTRAITAIAVTDLLTLAILELIIIIVITMTTRIKIIINWTWKASLLWPACWLSPQSTPCKNIWSSCKLSLNINYPWCHLDKAPIVGVAAGPDNHGWILDPLSVLAISLARAAACVQHLGSGRRSILIIYGESTDCRWTNGESTL